MFVTRLFSSSLRLFAWSGTIACLLPLGKTSFSQTVPSQANIDASAQRRLQETAREAQRQRQIEEEIRILAPALDPQKLAGTNGPVFARKAIAALARLREEGVPPDEALARATRAKGLDPSKVAQPAAYVRNLFAKNSSVLNDDLLKTLATGQDPAPRLVIPPFRP